MEFILNMKPVFLNVLSIVKEVNSNNQGLVIVGMIIVILILILYIIAKNKDNG